MDSAARNMAKSLCNGAASLLLLGNDHSWYGFDPSDMGSHGLDARNILGRDDRGFALVRSKNDTPQLYNTVSHRGVELGRPGLFGQVGHELIARPHDDLIASLNAS